MPLPRIGTATLVGGLVLGAVLVFEVVVGTGWFALLWPVLGGALAGWMALKASAAREGAAAGAKAGFGAALIANGVLLTVGLAAGWLAATAADARPDLFGRVLPYDRFTAVLMLTVLYALMTLALAAAGGAVAAALASRSRRR